MDDARRGQIAILFIKYKLREGGVQLTEGSHLAPDFRQHVGNTSKALGIQFEEALEFADSIAREMIEEDSRSRERSMRLAGTRVIGFTVDKK